jgi:hypothetical protein
VILSRAGECLYSHAESNLVIRGLGLVTSPPEFYQEIRLTMRTDSKTLTTFFREQRPIVS